MTYRPSAAATPSKELRRPLKLSVEPLSSVSSLLFVVEVDEERVGTPVDFSSREIPRVKAASKSSKSKIHLLKRQFVNHLEVLGSRDGYEPRRYISHKIRQCIVTHAA